MSHLIITAEQANQIRGRYGKYSAIEPVEIPDGNYIVPEDCLSDADLAQINSTLVAMATNVQDIQDIPAIGQECVCVLHTSYPTGWKKL